jgi:Bacterial TSP3 repeat
MTDQNDELLFGAENTRARDTDGDGVSDAQERLDGTDPNDAESSVRHDTPVLDPDRGVGDDPRAGVDGVLLERETIVDVLGSVPAGHSLDQTLGTGLDGNPIGKSSINLGFSAGDQLLEGRATDPNSPLNMDRDPLAGNTPSKPTDGQGSSEGTLSSPPPGAELNFNAPNMGLVSDTADGGTPSTTALDDVINWLIEPAVVPDAGTVRPPGDTKVVVPKVDAPAESASERQLRMQTERWKKKGTTDPDADTGGIGVITEDQIERAIVVQGADIDFVEGAGTHIEGDAPPKRPLDLVTDPGDEDPGAGQTGTGTGTGTVAPPGQEISKPINPQDGLPGSPTPGSGTGTGDGGDNTGRDGIFSYATAATQTDLPGSGSGVTNIGDSSTGGIQSVAGDDTETTPPTDSSATDSTGRASQSSAMMAGDDDDLEELEVQRADMAAAGPGTQTEDEIYIGATSAPVSPTGGDSSGGSGGSAAPAPVDDASLPVSMPVATVAGIITPILELEGDATEIASAGDLALGIEVSPRSAPAPTDGSDLVGTIVLGPIIGRDGAQPEDPSAQIAGVRGPSTREFEVSVEDAVPPPLDPVAEAMAQQQQQQQQQQQAEIDSWDQTFVPLASESDQLAVPEDRFEDGG